MQTIESHSHRSRNITIDKKVGRQVYEVTEAVTATYVVRVYEGQTSLQAALVVNQDETGYL